MSVALRPSRKACPTAEQVSRDSAAGLMPHSCAMRQRGVPGDRCTAMRMARSLSDRLTGSQGRGVRPAAGPGGVGLWPSSL